MNTKYITRSMVPLLAIMMVWSQEGFALPLVGSMGVEKNANQEANKADCNNVCGLMEELQTKSDWKGYCQAHGVNTGGATFTDATEHTTTSSSSNFKCSVPVIYGNASDNPNADYQTVPEDALTAKKQCEKTGNMINACKFAAANSMIMNYCTAYKELKNDSMVNEAEVALVALDYAAAGVCLAECVSPNQTINSVCGGLAAGAGVFEFMSSLSIKNDSGAARYINGMLALPGAAGGVATLGANSVVDTLNATKDSNGVVHYKGTNSQSNSWMACATAGIMGAMGIVRTGNLIWLQGAANRTCEKIQELKGGAGAFSPTGEGNGGNGIVSNLSGNSGTSGGTDAAGATTGVAGITDQKKFESCLQNGATNKKGEAVSGYDECKAYATNGMYDMSAGAMDSKLVSKMKPPVPDLKAFKDQLKRDGGAATLASMMPATDAGALLAKTAEAIATDPDIAGKLGISNPAATYGSAGGGAGSGGKSDGANPLAALFGQGGGGGLAGGAPGTQTFGKSTPANDIWHSNTHMNLFEIVSDKIGAVSTRVK